MPRFTFAKLANEINLLSDDLSFALSRQILVMYVKILKIQKRQGMKEIQKEQNERFWRINEICKLIAKTPLSTSQIAEKLGVSERTIQRDLTAC